MFSVHQQQLAARSTAAELFAGTAALGNAQSASPHVIGFQWAPTSRHPLKCHAFARCYFFAPGGSKAPLLKMSEAFEYFAESSFLKKLSAVNRSSPAVQAS